MHDFPFAIVGFDLDGTLLDTSGDLTAAVNHALGEAGRPLLTRDEVEPMIGGGAKNMLRLALDATGGCSDEEFRRLYKLLLGFYEAHIAVESRPFPGMIEAVDVLKAMGVKVGIVTNKFEALAEKLMRELNLRDRFDCLIGGDTLGKGNAKPSAAPILHMIELCGRGPAAFVGDSIYDMQAARNAGIPSIAVSFGFLMQPVEELKADAVIDSYEALVPVLQRLSSVTV
ncbi:HAD-IA family hydrolase [Sphingomonas cannabina]|uniref:HAD-IA family hydrolase n=1 Tax=Sphingomonas cannabina TaxID=2899123 RepID=UPI001F2E6A2B|nr:HAD-IA family hydrolase [Sphingomonas cannabina]UIJ46955.1 HAD-IA family hydrolase [Sphingomonas cannabina]